jgi:5-oxoprolinase (ATP-hydrolysing) subunit A
VKDLELVALGDSALLCPLPDDAEPRAVLEALHACAHVIDVVVAESCACVYFDPADVPSPEDLRRALVAARGANAAAGSTRLVHVRARFDGVDLGGLAAKAGLDAASYARAFAGREYTVRMIGFLPGFAYLGEVEERLSLPRRPTPRPRVEPGAIGVAGRYAGIYPFASPGGWNLVGTAVDFVAFDTARGAALSLGDRVRFEPVE